MTSSERGKTPFEHAIVLLGIPSDVNSSFARGAALAPDRIREALSSEASNLWSETGYEISAANGIRDAGNLKDIEGKAGFEKITHTIQALLDHNNRVIVLGGDHAITFPIIRGYTRRFPPLTLLHFDAHPDLYDSYGENRFSHACPMARIMEAGLVTRLVQVGVRTFNTHQREQARRFGVETIEMRHLNKIPALSFKGPVYLSLDMDVLDPAFAPGVSHPEPGGMSPRDVITLIQSLDAPLAGADIVEYNPKRDPTGLSAIVAAKLLKEIAGKMLDNK